MKILVLTVLALIGFAGNSILCRMALAPDLIDAASFTTIRIFAGALTLALLTRRRHLPGDWHSAAALFSYAILFSYAYARIGAAVGALILFGSVQATMIGWGLRKGERVRPVEWLGLFLALGGLVALALPGLSAPDPVGISLMMLSGVAWGIYSLRGRGVSRPLLATAGNFMRCVPMAAVMSLATMGSTHANSHGLALAVASGAFASGIGYSIWYSALPGLTATRAAFAQLSVPVLAAGAAVWLLDEPITHRLLYAAAAVLAGVALTVLPRPSPPEK
jgi:drug/metabolite transporter (DMT)-like permease